MRSDLNTIHATLSSATSQGWAAQTQHGRAGARSAGDLHAAGNGAPPANGAEPYTIPFTWSLDRSSDVGRALLAATRRLAEAGSDTPQLDASLLLSHVLGVNKAWLYAHPTRELSESEIVHYEETVRRRMRHEPVAYLVGSKPFYGLDIAVDRNVLIPRPETELLVDRVLDYLQSLVSQGRRPLAVDVGTGSGAIAVALAANMPDLTVYAVDVSDAALAVAARNIRQHGLAGQAQVLQGHLLEPLTVPVDVIAANLPYIASADLAALPPQVREYEPALALDGGEDGLRVIAELLASLAARRGRGKLNPGGRVYLEIGAGQGAAACALVRDLLPGAEFSIVQDYADLDRLLIVAPAPAG
jgi:release factor glutamine methyltransferase